MGPAGRVTWARARGRLDHATTPGIGPPPVRPAALTQRHQAATRSRLTSKSRLSDIAITDVRSVLELESYFPLADLEEALIAA
jgi:hypothetical protein